MAIKQDSTKRGKKKTKKRTSKPTKDNRVSNLHCPSNMELKQWQRLLRQQQAHIEHFGIEPIDPAVHPGTYRVTSPSTHSEYKVVYRGTNSKWNFCSCMDFKSSMLGTCKHIEAIKHKRLKVHKELPANTSVYLDYTAGRKVRIRIGSDNAAQFVKLAEKYFHNGGVLCESGFLHFDRFLREARAINDTFCCYQDAFDFVLSHRSRKMREDLVSIRCTDAYMDKLLTVKLFPYQKEGVRFAFKAGKSIIADEMGLGKTIQALGTAEMLLKEKLVSNVLIVAPTSLKYQWKREIERFAHNAQVVVLEGSHLKRKEMYNCDATYRIVSYNAMCNDVNILGKLQCDMLIMDEVQRLKNWNTKIARAARRIMSDYTVVLSGTPLENKLEELYSIVQFVDQYVLAPYYQFRTDCIMTDETGKVLGYKNLNQVGSRLKSVLIRRRKADVNLQLPGRIDKNLIVPMTREQREQHDELKSIVSQLVMKWQRHHFLSEADRKRLLLMLSQMRMLCDSTYILDQKTRHDTKVDETINILTSIFESSPASKVVIFSQWERMTRIVARELEKRGIGFEYLHGGVPSEKRKDLMVNFTESPDSRVFLSTDAGSTGLNLQVANTVINLDLPWNPAVLEQRIARAYRLGQKDRVQVINLVSADTIEEQMIAKLKFKTSMFEGVLDGGEDSVFASDDKFKKILEVVDDYVTDGNSATPQEQPIAFETEETTEPAKEQNSEDNTETGSQLLDSDDPINEGLQDNETAEPSTAPHATTPHPDQLISQGMSFFAGLAETLKSPESTKALVDSLVVEDKETGQQSLRIPVPDKATVTAMLQLVGKLFGTN